MKNKYLIIVIVNLILITLLISGCITQNESDIEVTSEDETNDDPSVEYIAARPDPAYDNFTWTLPTGASSVRLSLPADIEDIFYSIEDGIGGFGVHAGAHLEGLDHIWMYLKQGTPVKSWGDGVVTRIKFWTGVDHYSIMIDYGDNLIGEHKEVGTVYVEEGDNVLTGQEVGVGITSYNGQTSAEMNLVDTGRTDGVTSWLGGIYVSAFDYLKDSEKRKIVDAYKEYVIDPWMDDGTKRFSFFPEQPYLTNNIFIYEEGEKISGSWYLISSDWGDGYPSDLLTIVEADNPYYTDDVIRSVEYSGNFDGALDGTVEIDYETNQLHIIQTYNEYYGIFEVDESEDRAKLKIEYQEGSYPTGFSSRAATYIIRSNDPPREDGISLGVLTV